MLILTARTRTDELVVGFETGADDYIAKPFETSELVARIKGHLRRAARRPMLNPLSGLPGGTLLSQRIQDLLNREEPFALIYADLDNFKSFNDTYGFSRGDRAILMLAGILRDVLSERWDTDDFIGHIGGDDFALITKPSRVDAICKAIINSFNRGARSLYDLEDWLRGYLSGTDRYGILRRFKLLTISMGVATTERRSFNDTEEIARVAAEMKHYAKAQSGSNYAVDQRGPELRPMIDRRSVYRRKVLIASDDPSLRAVLRSALHDAGFIVHEVIDVVGLRQRLDGHHRPALVLADAQLGEPLWGLCSSRASTAQPPIVVLTGGEDELAHARAAGATVCLSQPLPLTEVVLCVERLTLGDNLYGTSEPHTNGTT